MVFLGIAFLVYHIAFKLLGIGLLIVELGWFILLPIHSELALWWKRRAATRWNRATRRSALGALVVLLVLFTPWPSDVRAPAVMGAAQAQGLYAVSAARVVGGATAAGTQVTAGQVLVQLESADLRHQLALAQNREGMLRWELDQQPFDARLQQEGTALRERWTEAAAAVKGLQEQTGQLVVRAPFAGRVADANESLVPGAWIPQREKLFQVVGINGAKAEAFVGETELAELHTGSSATFISDAGGIGEEECRVGTIDRVNLSSLDELYLASTYGGPIAVQKDKQGLLIPTEAWYRVHLENCGNADTAVAREVRGVAHLQGPWTSIAERYFRRAATTIKREMGF